MTSAFNEISHFSVNFIWMLEKNILLWRDFFAFEIFSYSMMVDVFLQTVI